MLKYSLVRRSIHTKVQVWVVSAGGVVVCLCTSTPVYTLFLFLFVWRLGRQGHILAGTFHKR